MQDENQESTAAHTNTRDYHPGNDRRYLILVILTLVIGGGSLIALIYGPSALLTALPCLLAGAALILLPWFLLSLLGIWRERMDKIP